jgi:iron(III) transport system substrate-binding protein
MMNYLLTEAKQIWSSVAWRKGWVQMGFLPSTGLIILFILGISQTESHAASQQMIKDAEKEGKVVFYTTVTIQQADKLLAAFTKRYAGIKAEYLRTSQDKILTRVVAEDSAGRTMADVVQVNDVVLNLLRLKRILGKYDNPEATAYGPEFKDPDGYWTGFNGITDVIVYNTKMVKPEDVPKKYEDLLDPKWKGKMGMDGSKFEWFAAQLQNMGQEKGLAFMKKLVMPRMRKNLWVKERQSPGILSNRCS